MKNKDNCMELWADLNSLPMDELGLTNTAFLHFPPGTDRETICSWFEEKFDICIADECIS